EQWPSSGDIVSRCDLDAITAAALADATADDMLTVLHSMPNGHRQYLLGALGLRSAVTVNRGMAAQLLARLRGDKAGPRGPLLHAAPSRALPRLAQPAAGARWAAMAAGAPRRAADAYAEYPHFTAKVAYVARHYSPALLRAALAAGIANDNPGAAVA